MFYFCSNKMWCRTSVSSVVAILVLFLAFVTEIHEVNAGEQQRRDPYEVLGVSRRASQQEIKRSYKKLARQWHPDKNKADGAEQRFVEINQAYELLSDPKRKERYDRYGEFSDSPNQEAGGFQGDFPFGNFGPFQFRYQSSSNFFSKHRITLRMYENNLLEESYRKPYILFAYSDWCMSCLQAEPIWEKIVNDLDSVGYGIGTVNNMLDGTLINRIRVRYLPSVVLLIEGKTVHYRGHLNVKDVIKFAKNTIPSYFVTKITDKNLRRFLASWKTYNKISFMNDFPRLRYTLAAMHFQNYARFGYVHLGNSDDEIRDALDIKANSGETVLVFNDRPESGPVATLAMKVISRDSLLNLVENNKYLLLPRLSSQQLFDELCPPNAGFGSKSYLNRKLCAILVVNNAESDTVQVDSFRDFVEFYADHHLSKEKIRFLYMCSDVQTEFINALKPQNLDSDEHYRDVVVVWRTERNQAKFDWLRRIWNGHKDRYNQSSEMLMSKVNGYLQGKSILTRDAALKQIVDEFRPSKISDFVFFSRKKVMNVLWAVYS